MTQGSTSLLVRLMMTEASQGKLGEWFLAGGAVG